MKYYLIRQDFSDSEKWVLGDIHHVDNWLFRDPPDHFMEPGQYHLDVRLGGAEVDYSLAGYASVPVVSDRFVDCLAGLPEVDEPYRNVVFERVHIKGAEVSRGYHLMIIEARVDCIDEEQSSFEVFEENDPVRPDLAGKYRIFSNLVVDGAKAGGRHIFRLEKYSGVVLVSEEVKFRLEQAGVTGAVFGSVNGDEATVA